MTASANQRRRRRRGNVLREASFLAGDTDIFPDQDAEVELAENVREPLRAAIHARLGEMLVFGDEIRVGSDHAAARARRSESDEHRRAVTTMVGLLRRLSYVVYPGDVGVAAVPSTMADLVAAAPDGSVLFVECLTKASIKRGAHEHKRALAEQVPYCFVGALPKDFIESLPPTAYAVPWPGCVRMSHGELVPHFWRREPRAAVVLDVTELRGRTVRRYAFTMPALRLAEDVRGMVWGALRSPLLNYPSGALRYDLPRAHGGAPFDRVGLPDSTLRIVLEGSCVEIAFGRMPDLIVEVRGTLAAFDIVLDALRVRGLQVNLVTLPASTGRKPRAKGGT